MLRRGLCLLLTAALCLTTGCVADRAAMQAEAEQALLAQQEEALRQEEAERRARQEERRQQAGEVLHAEILRRGFRAVGDTFSSILASREQPDGSIINYHLTRTKIYT